MGKAKKRRNEGPHISWRNGRAYADFRAYADVGGGKGALCEPGSKWGTQDPEIAKALFASQLAQFEARKKGRVGVEQRPTTTLAELARDHLMKKAEAGRTSRSHMTGLEQRLRAALDYFGNGRDPNTVKPEDVRDWAKVLATGGKRKPGTVRHYLNAVSGLYRRAQEGLYVPPGYNPVAALMDKPTGRWKGKKVEKDSFLEVHEATLVLEAARVLDEQARRMPGEEQNRVNATPGLYPIIATLLLTGGRKSEVLGLDVEDVSFDRGLVVFRPNAHRDLKTETSDREVPLWPQLRDILQEWMFGGDSPRTSGLLFPAQHGGMVGDLRKSLDALSRLCGMPSNLRTRPLRDTYCSARLQTVQRIVKPGMDPVKDGEKAYEWIEVSKFTVVKEMGHGGTQMVDRIYGHAQRNPYRSEVVEYRLDRHADQLSARLSRLRAIASV